MPKKTTTSAPGKIILFGEHAVVYGEPAIAVPVTQVGATAAVETAAHDGILLRAPDLGEDLWLRNAPADHPLAAAVHALFSAAKTAGFSRPNIGLTASVSSTIPIASGLGSGAAIAAVLIRALAQHLDWPSLATDHAVSQITYEVERIHHGTPSGIDNTVVSYGRPVFFVRAGAEVKPRSVQLLETFEPADPLHFLIGDTGIKAPTRESVGDVRRRWLADPQTFEAYFDRCGQIALAARKAIERGDLPEIGRLMNQNHQLLRQLTVSSAALDNLVAAAVQSGALGAKMSGGGRGGNMIALVEKAAADRVKDRLLQAGAVRVLETDV
ncbi:MAG: mevalonate kinase [Ardenticatenaceae bacterium]|nr:mevalonate kinase [Ardenticatenaceae bacterium]